MQMVALPQNHDHTNVQPDKKIPSSFLSRLPKKCFDIVAASCKLPCFEKESM